jgi:predicted nucleotidyltransferase
MNRKDIENRMILLGVVGSHAYGLNRPGSDVDIKGITIGDESIYLGFKQFEQKDSGWKDEEGGGSFPILDEHEDITVYELKKYLRLASDCNPNILELLFLKEYIRLSPVGDYLRAVRNEFLTTKVKHTYSGYSYSQIKRVERHRSWLLNPPTKKPELKNYGLSNSYRPMTKVQVSTFLEFLYRVVRDSIEFMQPAEELYKILVADIDYKGAFKQHPLPIELDAHVQLLTNASEEFMALLHKTQSYNSDMGYWNSYQEWKTNRNPMRAAIEKKCGYDGKHFSQAIRLLTTGLELLRGEELHVDRTDIDAPLLLAIKVGDVSYEDVSKISEGLFSQMELAYNNSPLPKFVDKERINEICITCVKMVGL